MFFKERFAQIIYVTKTRIQTMLNTSIKVLTTSRVAPTIDILWTRSDQPSDHNYNHFVPIFISQRNDYAAQSQQKGDKQIKISKLFKRQLELTNSSTKKGRGVNFSLEIESPHLRTQHIYYLLMKHPYCVKM